MWDVLGHLAAGRVIDSWGVAQGYRADLMAPGDRCFVWVTGPRGASWTPGIWAAGVVTVRPVPTRERRRLRVGLDVRVCTRSCPGRSCAPTRGSPPPRCCGCPGWATR